jgi:hypothetical protein
MTPDNARLLEPLLPRLQAAFSTLEAQSSPDPIDWETDLALEEHADPLSDHGYFRGYLVGVAAGVGISVADLLKVLKTKQGRSPITRPRTPQADRRQKWFGLGARAAARVQAWGVKGLDTALKAQCPGTAEDEQAFRDGWRAMARENSGGLVTHAAPVPPRPRRRIVDARRAR